MRRVQPRFSEAVYIPDPGRPEPRAEDGVRISRGRIRVAITPVLDLTASASADVRRVPYLLATALERSKRFQVVDPLARERHVRRRRHVRVEEVLGPPGARRARSAKKLEVAGVARARS